MSRMSPAERNTHITRTRAFMLISGIIAAALAVTTLIFAIDACRGDFYLLIFPIIFLVIIAFNFIIASGDIEKQKRKAPSFAKTFALRIAISILSVVGNILTTTVMFSTVDDPFDFNFAIIPLTMVSSFIMIVHICGSSAYQLTLNRNVAFEKKLAEANLHGTAINNNDPLLPQAPAYPPPPAPVFNGSSQPPINYGMAPPLQQ